MYSTWTILKVPSIQTWLYSSIRAKSCIASNVHHRHFEWCTETSPRM